MKKIATLLIVCILMTGCNNKVFKLEHKYYENYNQENPFLEIENEDLNKLIEDKESFAIFVYQPMCVTSSDFEQVLKDFTNKYQINFYKISFSNIKDTILKNKIKYYPSFVIFEKGKVVDYLESDKDEDIEYYKSFNGFKIWFTKYVQIGNNTSDNTNFEDNNLETSNQDNQEINDLENIELDIVHEENKVNIYFFWGNGCPHCEEEMQFFESIEKEYGKYYNLYKFEVWYNDENARLFNIFANAIGDNAQGVPYTIIGEHSFIGFGENYKEEFIKTIEEQHKNNFDIYFDKIKK